ncbi:DoxX family protein [Winogradskyella thalassocola]|uniref:Putative oxidoreductase n=1 Tax=Winogradskyella thalassocola TaxID=262004 RepID=A0A1G7YZY7_9FLAO|nr:DoxX family protein [Winogradskyella thalassocola]SDH01440.1 putative oxidoreductase [Winogradskyella thalassocola]
MRTSNNSISTINDLGLLLLRLFLGLGMCFGHGLGKWNMLFSGGDIQFADPFGLGAFTSLVMAVFAEVVCSVLIALGILTRWALVPLIITMLVAVFIVHISDGFSGMEKAMLYGMGYITLLFTGPGKFSIDAFLKSKNK